MAEYSAPAARGTRSSPARGRQGRTAAGHRGRARRDHPAVGAHRGADHRRHGRGGRRAPPGPPVRRAALVGVPRPGVADERVLLLGVPIVAGRTVGYGPHRPGGGPGDLHPLGAGRGPVADPAPLLRPQRARPRRGRGPGGAHPAPRHRRRRRRDLRVLRPARPQRDRLGRRLRPLVARQAPRGGPLPRLRRRRPDRGPSPRWTSEFPDSWTVGPADLPVSYTFDPGAGRDGVSVEVDVSCSTRSTTRRSPGRCPACAPNWRPS
jgi:hypothetical protein